MGYIGMIHLFQIDCHFRTVLFVQKFSLTTKTRKFHCNMVVQLFFFPSFPLSMQRIIVAKVSLVFCEVPGQLCPAYGKGDPKKLELSSRGRAPCSVGFPYQVNVLGTHMYQCTSWCGERLCFTSVDFSEDFQHVCPFHDG